MSQEIPAIRRESVEYAILQTTEFLGKIDHLLQDSRSSWVLGTAQPTALDAHLICFVARLKDVARESLVPEGVLKYAERAMDGVEWKEIMDGRQTVPPAGF